MKERKNDNNPIIRKSEMTSVRKDISNYLANQYPDWLLDELKEEIHAIVKDAINSKPQWFVSIVKEIIEKEIKDNLSISMSGYSSVRATLSYKGSYVSSASKYIP